MPEDFQPKTPSTATNQAASPSRPFEAPEHHLRMANTFIDPLWLNTVRGRTYDAVVAADGSVTVERETLLFADVAPAPGAQVRVPVGRQIIGVFQTDWARAVQEHAAAQQAAAAADAAKHAAWQADAKAFNARLQLPVRWTSAIKDVLSGLSATSWGDGRNRATVNHILLLEDLQEAKLARKAGDFLCTAAQGSNGRRYSLPELTQTGGDGAGFVQKITCRRCLDLAKRWTAQ